VPAFAETSFVRTSFASNEVKVYLNLVSALLTDLAEKFLI